jgi:CRISPR-associated protein Cmr5
MKTLEQQRASYAYSKISHIATLNEDIQEKYHSYVRSAPALILRNGLGNTLAYYLSKAKVSLKDVSEKVESLRDSKQIAYAMLYLHITEWLKTMGYGDLEWITNEATSLEVFQATKEAIALLNWMRRFADAMLKEGDEQ